MASVQIANLRRGAQDYLYLALARERGLLGVVEETLATIVPRVFSEAGDSVSFPEHGDAYEHARYQLRRALADN